MFVSPLFNLTGLILLGIIFHKKPPTFLIWLLYFNFSTKIYRLTVSLFVGVFSCATSLFGTVGLTSGLADWAATLAALRANSRLAISASHSTTR